MVVSRATWSQGAVGGWLLASVEEADLSEDLWRPYPRKPSLMALVKARPRPGLDGTVMTPVSGIGGLSNSRRVQGMYSTMWPFGMAAIRCTWTSGIRCDTTGKLKASAMPATFIHWVMPP